MNQVRNKADAKRAARISPRILTAFLGIPVVLAIVYFGGWLLAGFTLLLATMSSLELINATKTSSTRIEGFGVGFFAVPLAAIWHDVDVLGQSTWRIAPSTAAIVALLVVITLAFAVTRFNSHRKVTLLSLSLTVFASLYVSLFGFISALQSVSNGHALLWLTLFCVWTGDTVAYFGGRRFGKTKLTPLSPGKSREGALLGFVGSILVGALLGGITPIGLMNGIALGALVGVFAPLGDLAESFWKRELGVKDLGTILPGHGGVLDRCDSLLFAAPIAYFYAKWFLN